MFVEPAEFVERADAAVKVDEIGAAAEEEMLAVVDDFAGARVLVGRCASADVGAALNEAHFVAGVGECLRGGESGDTSPDDCYGLDTASCFGHR